MTGPHAIRVLPGHAQGPVLALGEGLSFWGGVDPATARIIDAHHPMRGACLSGAVLVMPTSRGSCSGSGVLLDMALNDRAPAALIFAAEEEVLTLGALIAALMFDRPIPVLRLPGDTVGLLAGQSRLTIGDDAITGQDGFSVPISAPKTPPLILSKGDQALLDGDDGPAAALAMQIVCAMAAQQGARQLTDITRGHIDGCIYAHPANLIFAERMNALGARVRVPTTINAISVDRQNWQAQGVPPDFGAPAARLADAYLRMGCQPSFTCAPYLLDDMPGQGEVIAWAESNAVIYANSVLGARTPKHADFLDLCMAVTGRAPLVGVYLEDRRRARRVLDVAMPPGADESIWPLLGYVAGLKSPDRIPLLRGLQSATPLPDDLKALCAAFGTSSAAPMLHLQGITPEAEGAIATDADRAEITRGDLAKAWAQLNEGPDQVDLVAIGSPHASLSECRCLAQGLSGHRVRIPVIVTAGRQVIAAAGADGTLAALHGSGVQVLPDLCWCSITEPVFPPAARVVMTNSGKYAHYGPGLSGRAMRFGSMTDCIRAALTGSASAQVPDWLR